MNANTFKNKKVIRDITEDLEILSGDSLEEQIRTKYPVKSFFNKDVYNS